jgi:hypothetical protein
MFPLVAIRKIVSDMGGSFTCAATINLIQWTSARSSLIH